MFFPECSFLHVISFLLSYFQYLLYSHLFSGTAWSVMGNGAKNRIQCLLEIRGITSYEKYIQRGDQNETECSRVPWTQNKICNFECFQFVQTLTQSKVYGTKTQTEFQSTLWYLYDITIVHNQKVFKHLNLCLLISKIGILTLSLLSS